MTVTPNEAWLAGAKDVVQDLKLDAPDLAVAAHPEKARRSSHDADDGTVKMAVVERGGLIYLEDRSWSGFSTGGLRNDGDLRIRPGTTLMQERLERLPPSKVYEKLEKADRKLTPLASDGATHSGLRSWSSGRFKKEKAAVKKGRILLIVHGTFSNCDTVIGNIQKSAEGQAFLKQAQLKYTQILAFDHRTLGVSPFLNATQLGTFLDGSDADVDIICHSRGGLVSRWWAEVLDKNLTRKTRIAYVASPMAGTSLASPHNIRDSMNLLANYSRMAGFAAGMCPLFSVATVLFEAISSITRVMAKTPVADAAVALVPGLDAMSRVGNNHALLALQNDILTRRVHDSFAVTSNFEPEDVGWKFWKAFRDGPDRLKNAAADFVFQADNDLVVDTASMTQIPQFKAANVYDFGTNGRVHHTNYFEQPQTIDFLSQRLLQGLPELNSG